MNRFSVLFILENRIMNVSGSFILGTFFFVDQEVRSYEHDYKENHDAGHALRPGSHRQPAHSLSADPICGVSEL